MENLDLKGHYLRHAIFLKEHTQRSEEQVDRALNSALFIQYVNNQQEFFTLAEKNLGITFYLDNENFWDEACRIAEWAITRGHIEEIKKIIIEIFPKAAKELAKITKHTQDAQALGPLAYAIHKYTSKEELKKRIEIMLGIHYAEAASHFYDQVYQIIKKAQTENKLKLLIDLALQNIQQK